MAEKTPDITGWKLSEHGIEGSRWTVLEKDIEKENKGNYWKCICECGKIKSIRLGELLRGRSKSCGCLARELRVIDMTGWVMKEHGVPDSLLTVLYLVDKHGTGSVWHCKCECGNEFDTNGARIRSGGVKSCGCLSTLARQLENQRRGRIIQIGDTFGKLTVIADLGLRKQKSRDQQWRWSLCQCSCGSAPIEVANNLLMNGQTKSCGCIKSYGETVIQQILEAHHVEYKREYSFDDLRGPNNGLLRFDFAIFENNQLQYLLEFDGRNHFAIPEGKWGNYYTLQDIQEKDRKKNDYCLSHNILLKRIPYTEGYNFTYEDIISDKYNIKSENMRSNN